VLISAHLCPYSAFTAAQEAAVLVGRAHRTGGPEPAGGYGIVAGDINHIPPGDTAPPWDQVPPHDRVARSVIDADGTRYLNTIVGRTLADGALVDVAAHLAEVRKDPGLRAWTGSTGMVRTDQIHITELLLPALVDYWTVAMGDLSDHDGVVARLDLDRLEA
jgi:endonuclease/exonuclease/phosphatase family metal-dependent hydrolase